MAIDQFDATVAAGIVDTGTSPSTIYDQDWSSEITFLNKNEFPFVHLTREADKSETTEAQYNWFTDEFVRSRDQVNLAAGYAAGSTSIVVDNAAAWAAGSQGYVERTGDTFYVTAVVDSTNTLTISGLGEALINNDWLIILRPGDMDGATLGKIHMTTKLTPYNYVEYTRTPLGETLMANKSKKRAGISLDQERAKKLMEHQIELEKKFIWGTRYYDSSSHTIFTTDTHGRYFTGGILENVTTHAYDCGGMSISLTDWLDYFEEAFDTGSDHKLCIASTNLIKVLDGFSYPHITAPPSNETWGLTTSRWTSGGRTLEIIRDKLLMGNTFGYYGITIDPEDLKYRYLTDCDTRLLKNRQANDETSFKEEFMSVCGLEWGHEQHHSYIHNFAS